MTIWQRKIGIQLNSVLLILLTLLATGCQTQSGEALNEKSVKLFESGAYGDATEAARKTVIHAKSVHGNEHRDVATALDNLAVSLEKQSRFDEAEKNYGEALAIRQKVLEPDDPDLAFSYNNIASLYLRTQKTNQANSAFRSAYDLLNSKSGDHAASFAIAANGLGEVAMRSGDLGEADKRFAEAMKALGSIEIGIQEVGLKSSVLTNIAQLYRYRGDLPKARQHLETAKSEQTKFFGNNHPNVAVAINNIAEMEFFAGNYDAARKEYLQVLPVLETALGPDHPQVAGALSNLAAVDQAQGRLVEALRLGQKALAIQEKALGPDHADLASSLSILAGIQYAVGDYAKAGEMMARVNRLLAKAYGPEHPILADGLTSLGEIERLRGRPAMAEKAYRRAAEILVQGVGDTPRLASVYSNWAALKHSQNQYSQALSYYQKSESILNQVMGGDHPTLAATASGKARVYASQGDVDRALIASRSASAIVEKRFRATSGSALSQNALTELAQAREIFIQHLGYLALHQSKNGQSTANIEESFHLAQLARATGTAGSLGQMAARFASGSDNLARLIRQRQDLLEKSRGLSEKLNNALSQPRANRNINNEAAIRRDLQETMATLEAVDETVARTFPQFAELSNPKAATIKDIQKLLSKDEALVSVIVGSQQSFVWGVNAGDATFQAVDLSAVKLNDWVAQLRQGLDPMGGAKTDRNGLPAVFPGALAHDLYLSLFAGINQVVGQAKILHVAADGALESLPFQTLLTAAPATPELDAKTFAAAPWLIKTHAVSYLPAIASLRALRRFARPSKATHPFLGVGDPILANHPSRKRTTVARRTQLEPTARGLGSGFENREAVSTRGLIRGGLADVSMLKLVPSLPETADELDQMRLTLGAGPESLILREQAVESALKNHVDFAKYRVVAFATHGLVAGELQGFDEPALMLTPPKRATVDDDGLLTAGEIAKLSFDADLIVLSACNTASSSGEFGAEGLSGLAKAFFYAGSRALFVSHWAVLSKPTVRLTTTMLRRLREVPGMARAQAHQESVLSMIADKKAPLLSHPTVWAPFVIVGEGGTPTR